MPRQVRAENRDNSCHTCGRSFARNEHLVRHQRSHTFEKPFQCPRCRMRFSRRDVQEKHMKRCKAPSLTSGTDTLLPRSVVQQSRCIRACDRCRQRKVKCDGQHPCGPCQKTSMNCITTPATTLRDGRAHNHALLEDSIAGSSTSTVAEQVASNVRSGRELVDEILESPGTALDDDLARHTPGVAPASAQVMTSPNTRLADSDMVETPIEALPLMHGHASHPLALHSTPQTLLSSWIGYDWNAFEAEFDLTANFSNLSGLDYETWIQDFDNVVSQALPYSETPTVMSGAINMMKDHYQRKSLTASTFTRNTQHSWFSAPPDLRMYDKEVINVLLNLAKKHLADTFPVFQTFEFFEQGDAELAVAMAAVGALFCDVDGSYRIAKACYNDARRSTLAKFLSNITMDFDMLVNRVKTFILLEIYGLSSGDGRSFEFVEVFHGFLLQTVRTCRLLLPSSAGANDRSSEIKLLLDAVQLLECYRVILLQRPPTLAPFLHSWMDTNDCSDTSDQRHLRSDLLSRFDITRGKTGTTSSLTSLATVASLVWFSIPQGTYNQRGPALWKTEFIELAMYSWKDSQTSELDPWTTVLYHLAHINLHSNITILQRHARSVARIGYIPSHPEETVSIQRWLTGRHYLTARWHAHTLLEVVQTTIEVKGSAFHRLKTTLQSSVSHNHPPEPPHLPFAIYYASVVLWYGSFIEERDESSRNAHIEAGVGILMHLKIHIAKDLSKSLYELST